MVLPFLVTMRTPVFIMLVCLAIAPFPASASFFSSKAKNTNPGQRQFVQTGTASWYGNAFKGHKTASGERYDPEDLTAAHRSLPFGTMVRVTNLRNARNVVVRITNRGPYVKGRIIDLSHAAASRLDMIHSGITHVRIEVVQ